MSTEREPGQRSRGRRAIPALIALIVGAGALGFALSTARRPPISPSPSPASPGLAVTGTPPPPRPATGFGYRVADDPTSHQLVLFGGVGDYDATWLWNGRRWHLADPATAPPGRFDAAVAYDPQSARVMLFGGRLAGGELVNDTWGWDGVNWVKLDSGAGGPPPGEDAVMAWDAPEHLMLLVARGPAGGETFAWSGHWVRQPGGDLPAQFFAGFALDPTSGNMLLVSPAPGPDGSASTWLWLGDRWREAAAPTPQAVIGLALDPVAGRLLLLGGTGATDSSPMEWVWSGDQWTPLAGSTPPVGYNLGVATDLEASSLLLFGSPNQGTQLKPPPLHVWRWDGRGWGPED